MNLLELVCGIKIVICGDVKTSLASAHPTIIIMNQRTMFDWLFLYSLLIRVGCLQRERVILKRDLKQVPFFGEL